MRGKFINLLNTKPMIPIKELMHRLKINRMDYSAVVSDAKTGVKPKPSAESRSELTERFAHDTERLETLLGRSLEVWQKY